jgi:Ras-related protein Rab-8A
VATKCDKPDKKITKEQGQALADEYDMMFFETSAKSNLNVNETFMTMATQIKNKTNLVAR